MRNISLVTISAGLLVHIFTYSFMMKGGLDSSSFEFLFMAFFPYLLCLAIYLIDRESVMPLTASIAPLIIDCFAFYSVFIKPTSSTASLALIWVPIWNTLIIVPLGLLIGYGIDKSTRNKETAS